jgi:signal transduction histidine kinase
MTDGRRADTLPEPTTDAALVRRVRWRLLAWSSGSTLVVLLVLGSVLYAAVAGSLAKAATDQLYGRATSVVANAVNSFAGPYPAIGPPAFQGVTQIDGQPGLVIGGPASGTVATLTQVNGPDIGAGAPGDQLVDKAALEAVSQTGQSSVTEATIAGVSWRVLTLPVTTPTGTMLVQILGDRSDEQRTLSVLLIVLIAGGLVAVAASVGVGWLYAERALVPIRVAMRRQREFAADASHELRTPLTVIRSSVEHLRRNRGEPSTASTEALDDIDAEVGYLTALVEDLLLLARSDSGAITLARSPVDLGDVAADGAGALVKTAETRGVHLSLDPEPAIVSGDSARLRQLIVILVDNAVRHTPRGGSVLVRVRTEGREAVAEVEDDGPGIRPEDMPRVFERFWRAPGSAGGGTGLGLAIARSIVDLHEGRISVTNRPEGGARFTVRLPGAGEPPAAAESGVFATDDRAG